MMFFSINIFYKIARKKSTMAVMYIT
jgi:hypothetical protein